MRNLGEAVPLAYGKALAAKERSSTGEVTVYGSSGPVGMHDQAMLPGPAVLVGRKGSAGSVHYSAGPCWPIDTAYYAAPAADVDLRYSYYLLQWLRLSRLDQSTAIPSLGRDTYNELLAPFPALETQRRIVARIDELFSELDDGEEELRRARADLETYRKSLLKAAVTGELTAEWRAANPSDTSGAAMLRSILQHRREAWQTNPRNQKKRYEEPIEADEGSLPSLPTEWTWASLDQLSWASAYGTSQKCASDACGEPVLRIPNLKAGGIDLEDLKRSLVPLSLPQLDYVAPGDLLIVRTNGSADLIGRTGILSSPLPTPTHYASYLIRFRMTGGQERWRWIRAFTESPVFRASVLASIGSSAGQYNLSMSKLAAFPVAIPPEPEIAEILRRWSAAGMDWDDDFSAASATLRQSILAAAFRGELVQ